MLSSRSVQPSLDAGAFRVASWGADQRNARPKNWLRLGAASNVNIDLNGRPAAIPYDIVGLVLPGA